MSEQRIIVLTGASRGLGRAMARQFVDRGHIVYGCARSHESVDEMSAEFGTPHDFCRVDVSVEEQVAQWAQRVLRLAHAPDLVLNNAALINRPASLWDVPPAEFSHLVDVNVKGTFYVACHFLSAMLQRGSGVLVNFSSGWGRSTAPEFAPYCCSKWAIEGLTRALAAGLPDGLAAIPLNPGIIDTDMLHICFGSDASAYPSPDSWATRAVPFLLQLTPRNNGQPLTVPS